MKDFISRRGHAGGGITVLLLLLFTLWGNMLYAQDPPQYGTPFSGVPDVRDVNMYQVHIRPYSAAGNLQGVINRLDQIKALGTNVVYLMPHYPHGTDSRSSQSPYCIKDFKGVAAEYGTLTDLRNLVDGCHQRGMAVILDFVVNQTSWDHPWITQHPDYYVRSGGVIQPLNPFPDVAALDFNNTAMRAAIVDAMRYWIFAANVDGYRCDYANNAPLDFWTNTINNLRGITSHKLLMFAEGDRLTNFNAGFDMNFGDKWYYDAIEDISTGASVSLIQSTTNTEYTNANSVQQVVRYTANHDSETSITAIQRFNGHNGVVANFLVSAYMRGVPFLTSGQEVDFNQTIPWPYTSVKINWNANTTAAADFTKVLNFRTASAAIRRGTVTNYSNNDVCAFTKINGSEKVVVMVNMRNTNASFVIPSAMAGSYTDPFNNNSAATLTAGATQSLGAFQYRVLTNASVTPIAVASVSLSPATASVSAGLTRQLVATIVPANATNQNVTWSSSNNAVATVNAAGLVTAVAAGTATITVTTQDGNKTATSAITVTPSSTFTVHFYKPSTWGSGIRIYWWAAQPSGVLADGAWPGTLMTNVGNGWYSHTFTNVTSTNLIFNDGTNQTSDLSRNKTGWYMNDTWYDTNPGAPVAVTGVTVSPTTGTMSINGTVQLTATVAPSNAANKTVTWNSSNTTIATVSASGLVTGKASGSATITVTTQDGNKIATANITVTSTGTTYYQIVNRWQSNSYLYDGGNGQVRYGTNPSGNSYQWARIDVSGGYYVLKNRATGNIMHVENQNGAVQLSAGDQSWWSAQWSISATGDGWNYIINRWQTSQRIHLENLLGYVQYANAQTGWHSAMWQLVNPITARERTSERTSEENELVSIYPNPSRGNQLFVLVNGEQKNETAELTILDVHGKTFLVTKIEGYGKVMHDLTPGLYVAKVKIGNLNVTKKIIIE
ncbi:Ig-like domain-containing protein [Pseudochryseolinea flava]|uniref:Glycosyl hydrolase family 13 catalytic domain-containing protein n=1 Tax=Pseudochryseolinea flava TaxID=2059302 RepID=A0A364Y0I7_9BACT|nr:Ig-like domain-containing protein [Pseudochryseolinea flava]RAV99242.1 hypothetical protein DQQ10_20310 [Pseudochryseolinea flava]